MRRNPHHHLLLALLATGLFASVTNTVFAEQAAVQVPGTRVFVAPPVKGNVYYIVQGLVGTPGAEEYVPEFRKVLRTMSFAR